MTDNIEDKCQTCLYHYEIIDYERDRDNILDYCSVKDQYLPSLDGCQDYTFEGL